MSNSRTRIVFTVTTDLTFDQRMHRICHSLATAGFDITLIGRKKKHSTPLEDTNYQQKRIHCFFNKGKFFYIEYNIRLFLFLLTYPLDIIGSVDLDSLLSGLSVAKLRHKKCIFDAHEYFSEVPEVVNRPMTQKIWKTIAAFCIPKVDAAYTVSASLQALFSQQHGIPFQLIRNIAVSQTTPLSNQAIHQHILFYQGALNKGRGLEALLSAMPKIDNAVLWIAGEGDLSQSLREQVQALGITEKVQFLGYVLPAQLKKLTPQATIGLNLLVNKGLSYYYSLANKTFDYIQAGLPAIHPNFPEYQQLNQAYSIGLLVNDLNESTLVEAIHKLTTDQDLYQQLHQNCLQAAAELNWQQEEKRLIQLYQNLSI